MKKEKHGSRSTAPRARSIDASTEPTRVLVVDDDEAWRRLARRVIGLTPHFVDYVASGAEALRELDRMPYDAVVSDIRMAGMSGLELLRAMREHGVAIPVILVTGDPSIESAAEAVELGAFRYLPKPVSAELLTRAIDEAVALRRRTQVATVDPNIDRQPSRRDLEDTFASALRSLEMAYQPILAVDRRITIGFEALMRSKEPRLPTPPAVLEAAEKLGTTQVLGRRVRRMVADRIDEAPSGLSFFVNLHPSDLADNDLFDPRSALARHSRRVVLEVTERATLETIGDLDGRVRALRTLGYRLAIDDLGAGYAGLTSFVQLQPEIAKIDMSLVRDIDTCPVRQRVVLALANLAAGVGAEVVAEGVETTAERDALRELGCTYLQGYALGRPGPPFPEGRWG